MSPAHPTHGVPVELVAAVDRHRAIGRANALPWRLPDDLRRFKALTLGKPVLMGRRTAESLGRPLAGRRNLVMTRGNRSPVQGMETVGSVGRALEIAAEDAAALAVIGGGEIYALALPLATHLYLTHVDTVVADADAFFPPYDASEWRVVTERAHPVDARHAHAFTFVDYVRER